MTKKTSITKESPNKTSEKKINFLFKKVREFQEINQKYLIKTPDNVPTVKPSIIFMTNTSI